MVEFTDSKGVKHTIEVSMQARARVEWVATRARLALAGHDAKEEDYAVTFDQVLAKVAKGHLAEIIYVIQSITDNGEITPEDVDYILNNDRNTWIEAFKEASKEQRNPSEAVAAPTTSLKDGVPLDTNQPTSGKAKAGKSKQP